MTDPETVAKKAGVAIGLEADRSIILSTADSKVIVGGAARSPSTMPPLQCTICFETSSVYSAMHCTHACARSRRLSERSRAMGTALRPVRALRRPL